MKKLMFALVFVMLFSGLFAQAPQGITHQAVIRNAANELVTQTLIGVQVSILQGSAEGTAVFVETHSPTSNAHGLITYVIGKGTNVSGSFENIAWAAGPYFLKNEVDPAGGINYTITGTTQFLSVPYALHAGSSSDNRWEQIGNNIFSRNTGNVGIGTQNPQHKLHVAGNAQFASDIGIGRGFIYDEIGITDLLVDRLIAGKPNAETDLLYQYGGQPGTSEGLFINAGNVGIGTSNPSALFHAFGTGTGEGNVLFEGAHKFTNPGDPPASQANTRMMWYPDKAAFRVGTNILQNWSKDSIGFHSVAMGQNATAAGSSSFAVGSNVSSSGPGSVAIGSNASATGFAALTIGSESEATGTGSIAIGRGLKALSGYEFVVGSFNTEYDPVYSQDWWEGDRLFVIGNGEVDYIGDPPYPILRRNALTMLKNGHMGLGVDEPSVRLDIEGQIKIRGGEPGAGKVLTSDEEGVGNWQTAGLALPYIGSYNSEEAVFQVTNTAASVNSSGLYGVSSSHGTGVIGSGATGVKGLGGTGVYGESIDYGGFGVHGRVTYTGSGSPYGVFGESLCPTGTGVHGSGPTGVSGVGFTGVAGQSHTGGTGVFGFSSTETGTTYGVYGRSDSESGHGVFGLATRNNGNTYGGYFESNSNSGVGAWGENKASSGVNWGVVGTTHSDQGVGVYGRATKFWGLNIGVFGLSNSRDGRGIFGWNTSYEGVNYGGYFLTNGFQGIGVFGYANYQTGFNYGVYGRSNSNRGTGVYGVAFALEGTTYGGFFECNSDEGIGIYGYASADNGLTHGGYFLNRSNTNWSSGVNGINSATQGTTIGVRGHAASPDGYGVYSNGRFAATGTKSFQIDHPLDPANKYLNHYCTEGAEPLNVYSGNVITDGKGFATVSLPEYFESINRDFRYQLTVIDDSDDFVFAKVTQEVQNSRFIIRTSKPDVKVSWRVEGVRNDHWVKHHGAMAEQEKPAEHRGKYLNPEFFEMPKEMGVHFQPDIERPKNSKPQEFEHIEPQGPAQGVNQQFEYKENQ